MQQEKMLRRYLIGGNQDLVGTILSIQKKKNVRRKKILDPGYSILLYFNHLTARIERYLYNPNYIRDYNNLDQMADYLENNESKERKYRTRIIELYINLNRHIDNSKLQKYNFDYIKNNKMPEDFYEKYSGYILEAGKFNKQFMDLFFFEIYHRVLKNDFFTSYLNPDINFIKYFEFKKELPFGSSNNPDHELYAEYNIKEITAPRYLIRPDNTHLKQIYIPVSFSTTMKASYLNELLTNIGCKFVKKTIKDMPKCIKDLKSQINDKSINNVNDLAEAVMKFNSDMEKRIKKKLLIIKDYKILYFKRGIIYNKRLYTE